MCTFKNLEEILKIKKKVATLYLVQFLTLNLVLNLKLT